MVGTTALGMLAVAASTARVVSALDPDICATFNTAKMERFTDKLQSNGLCHDHCLVYYAFSITKGYDCWCSNVAPSESATVDLPNCNSACPGYPGEPCGGANGAFSYVRLRNIDRSSQPPKSTSQAESTQGDEPEPTSESSSPMSKSVTESESEPLITKSVTSEPTEPISTGIHTVAADRATKTVFVGPTDLPKNGDGYRGDGEIIGNDHNGNAGDGAVSKTLLLVLSSGGQANQRFQQTTSHGRHAHLAKPCGFSGQRKQGGQAAPGMEMKGFVCGRPEEYHQETLLANEIGVKD